MKQDYSLRGKCKELSEELCRTNTDLVLVRGFYYCHQWGKQQHWWAKDKNGKIHDPTVAQFPEPQIGEYVEFDGMIDCYECGKEISEEHALNCGYYVVCSHKCANRMLGI